MALALRIEQSSGMADAIESILKENEGSSHLSHAAFIFDFDRTLTNGFCAPGQDVPLSRRVRGGQRTLEALSRLKARGAKLYVVTAREPRLAVLGQIYASFTATLGSVRELAEFFVDPDESEAEKQEFVVDGVPLARWGRVYAASYNKPKAVRHIIDSNNFEQVYFFDDFAGNAYDVWAHLESVVALPVKRSYFWDTFHEEQQGEMAAISTTSSDFSYQDGTKLYLETFGVNHVMFNERLEMFRKAEASFPPVVADFVPPPVIKPIDADKKAALGGLLLLNRRPPPPA